MNNSFLTGLSKFLALGLGVVLLLSGCGKKEESSAQDDAIVITCGMVAQEHEACKKGVELWQAKTGKKVKVLPAPNGSNERLTLFQQHLAAGSSDIDIYQVDVVWPGVLVNHLEDLSPYLTAERRAKYIPSLLNNNKVEGKLVALPWFANVGILYYRKDLLEKYHLPVPQTWDDIEQMSKKIIEGEKKAGDDKLWGYVFQGKAYEGLTCNAIEWISSFKNGGTIVEKNGHVSVNNPDAIKILDQIAAWVGTISPQGVLNYEQEDCRGVFQLGQAIFMRNWPYAWHPLNSSDSAVSGKVGITLLPKGGKDGKSSGTIGGWNLAVSKYSKKKADAIDLVLFLTDEPELKRRAIESGYFPPMHTLFKDPQVLAINPLMKIMLPVMTTATPRPSAQTGSKYSQVSSVFWNGVYSTLSKQGSAEENLKEVQEKLNLISQNGTKWYR
ncbi:MAG: ABC transporter substrate-binding protein [Alphaproteobacteria bacterium]